MLVDVVLGLFVGLVLILAAEGLVRTLGADAERRITSTGQQQRPAHEAADAVQSQLERERRLRYLGGYR